MPGWRGLITAAWFAAGGVLMIWMFSVGSADFEAFARSRPWLGMPLGLLLVVISQVIAPLTGVPVLVALTRIYGLEPAVAVMFGSYLISYAVNFAIGRRLGQPAVRALVGRRNLDRGTGWLRSRSSLFIAASRTLGYYYNDLISYAWGLSPVPFRRYYLVSVAATVIPVLIEYAVLRQVKLQGLGGLALFYVAVLAVSTTLMAGWFVAQAALARSGSPPSGGAAAQDAGGEEGR